MTRLFAMALFGLALFGGSALHLTPIAEVGVMAVIGAIAFVVGPVLGDRRRAAADWAAKASAAHPGEVWTASYRTRRAVTGGHYASYTAGPVRIIGDECPVEEYRGRKTLGEYHLGRPAPGWIATLLEPSHDRLEAGDTAPTVPTGTGDDLAGAPMGHYVTVEHRRAHPVYGETRFVEIGRAGDIEDFDDDEGPGRDVGDTWVRLADVTGFALMAAPMATGHSRPQAPATEDAEVRA